VLALTLALALVAADAVGEADVTSTSTARATGTWTASLESGTLTAVHPESFESAASGRYAQDRLRAAEGRAESMEQDEYGWEGGEGEEDGAPRLFVTAWGGEAFDLGGDGRDGAAFGGEVAYALAFGDLGLWGAAYKIRNDGEDWAPIALLRLTNRFPAGRGVEAAFTFGVGAGRPQDWRLWFQVALGMRLDLGPMFLAGELSFEQEQLLRLSGGLGMKL